MKFKDFRHYFSSPRVSRYLAATHNSKSRSAKLYKANLKIAQAFHPLLGVLEVVLRNRINDVLAAYFTDPDWIINQKAGFMTDPSLRYRNKKTQRITVNHFLLTEVEKAERRLRKNNAVITSGKIIAEQTLGFWTDLFEVHHYKLLRGKPIQIFRSLPSGYGRKEVSDELAIIRKFRNRINHNEPVCFDNQNNINFSKPLDVHQSMMHILSWIDPELVNFLGDMDRVSRVINAARVI